MPHIIVYGPGDLGERIIYQLMPHLQNGDCITVAGRNGEVLQDIVNMAQMQSRALGAQILVRAQPGDLYDHHFWTQWLIHNPADIAIFTASELTWWKLPSLTPTHESLLAQTGFGVWLPFQATLLLRFARILGELPHPPWLVIGPYPDATAPLVKAQGLTRMVGFGNVDELALMAGPGDIRLVAHHSVESALFHGRDLPPYRLYARVADGHWQTHTLLRPFPWPRGTRSHVWTAASAVRTVRALLSDTPCLIHVPGALGLPGGYPALLSRHGVDVALPDVLTLTEAIAINQSAATADGIQGIEADGRVRLTAQCQAAIRGIFGVDVETWGPTVEDWDRITRHLRARLEEWSQNGKH
ncbi:MAG: hypothetical protein C7B45_11285 [Sulfobacillus acidophilus]|uniref:Uncharacterized protein n=1 Tax=Sulfobacillus acidophilus TaxID=53633 RepID=A0A2T2WGI8_9FIRM|nr:MAG: hypothetical protein C7B45_11285 [Sulfobacillus acidophilus]